MTTQLSFMTVSLRRTFVAGAMLSLVGSLGCVRTSAPSMYQLKAIVGQPASGAARGTVVGVGPIEMAGYLDRPQIVTHVSKYQLQVSESHMWAEPLKSSMLRVITVHLANLLGTNRVYRIPRRDKTAELQFRVGLDVVRFDGKLGGDAVVTVRWTLHDQQERVLWTQVSTITEPAGKPGHGPLVAAQNRALEKLSRDIAEAIKRAAAANPG